MSNTKFTVLKYIAYTVVAILLMVVQNTPDFLVFFGAKALWVAPMAIAVAVIEKETAGAIFGGFCGILCDVFSSYVFGYYTVLLFVFCMFTGVFCKSFIRPTIINSTVFSFLFILFSQWLGFSFTMSINLGVGAWYFLEFYTNIIVYTTIVAPLIFYIASSINKYTEKRIKAIMDSAKPIAKQAQSRGKTK